VDTARPSSAAITVSAFFCASPREIVSRSLCEAGPERPLYLAGRVWRDLERDPRGVRNLFDVGAAEVLN
jgi:hypothetical protein